MFWLDEKLFFLINGLAGRSPTWDHIMSIVAGDHLLPVAFTMIIITMWFIGRGPEQRERNQRAFLDAILAVGFTNAAVKIMNGCFYRPRPFEVYPNMVNLIFYQPTDSSFPANSAAVGFAFAFGILFKNPKASILPFVLAIIWSFGRVYFGVHFPTDILGAFLTAIVTSCLAMMFLKLVEPLPTWLLEGMRRLYLA